MARHVKDQLKDTDYMHKLSPEHKAYLIQFLYEHFQGDFNFEKPIHTPEMFKECRDRNNAARRQWHSVGTDLREESMRKARVKARRGHYTPEDYSKDLNYENASYDNNEE